MASMVTDTHNRKSYVDDDDDDDDDGLEGLDEKLKQVKRKIQGDRAKSVKEKFEINRKKVDVHGSTLLSAATSRAGDGNSDDMFSSRMEKPLCKLNGFANGVGDRDYVPTKEATSPSVKLLKAERIPTYTTWIFLDRNQRMAEDQSVVGRRQIYYEQHGGETLICSDSEEDQEPEEEKREYSKGEDNVIWLIGQEYGMCEEVQDALSQFLSLDSSDILERYDDLKLKNEQNIEDSSHSGFKLSLEKGLSAALDSFDNLFCRRCLVFDCRLHGCSQPLISASEKQPYWSDYEGARNPCSKHCYLQLRTVREVPGSSRKVASKIEEKPSEDEFSKAVSSDEATGGSVNMQVEKTDIASKYLDSSSGVEEDLESRGKREVSNLTDSNDLVNLSNKKQKTAASDSKIAYVNPIPKSDQGGTHDTNEVEKDLIADLKEAEPVRNNSVHDGGSSVCQPEHASGDGTTIIGEMSETRPPSSEWKPIEKDLYLKGVEIFGRNSCHIARNMLFGLKTCLDVSMYMHENEVSVNGKSSTPNLLLGDGRTDLGNEDAEVPPRTRLFRRKGKTRKLKYSTKSAGHPSVWKRIAGGKNQSCKQYTPCGCQSMCGKDCPCQTNETCCEKYCGCSKSCKNRFRGCHCAKSQCRSRQCPCFAAGRECDPDVCRNCWVSCGDGSLGEAPRRGEGQCGNMRLLLRQQQRILLGKSDVAGWGAFLKNSVSKNEYLGEYTGELISHREADKRGKIYDRANSSFLFDLNDQYVLDAQRKGDKLKFANHASKPNCYAKVYFKAPSKGRPSTIREVKASHIGQLVKISGIVTRCSDVKPLMAVAVYTCEDCGHEIYQEVTARVFMPLFKCPSSRCRLNSKAGNPILQLRASKFLKFQEAKMQELAEHVPKGHIPRSMTVHLRGELTRKVAPGDVVEFSGIFLPIPYTGFKAMRAGLVADTYLEATSVTHFKKKYEEYEFQKDEEEQIARLAEDGDIYNKLSRSLAPEIYGHEDIKKALLLLLVGAPHRQLKDGMKIRGDVHICLMGDPGVAKSQLLKHIINVAPRGVYTTGKGSSGVGLTAAVMRDQVTNEMVLEGGALVLADMGICAIDEFDKMDESDRTAIHEVMEQQTVSIAKAGITTSLNARTAVLAAANPAWGRYDLRRTPAENINLPPALLSRFDLLWLILDRADMDSDLELAKHVLHVHQTRESPALGFEPLEPNILRAYISAARRLSPYVPPELEEYIATAYSSIRQEEAKSNTPHSYTTVRTLLSILRISAALARLRFSESVAQSDVDEALRLMQMSKISLYADDRQKAGLDAISDTYSIIRDEAARSNKTHVSYANALNWISRKGYSEAQLKECLEEYAALNVWQIDPNTFDIHFI